MAFLMPLCLVGLIALSQPTRAQTPDDCMGAPAADAVAICQSLIDNGVRDAGVYWKLSSAQYQSGQAGAANRTLDTALRLYPGDTRLASLKEIITIDSSEQARIAESTRLNQSSLDRGALKITCLTRTGDVGISACRRRLELTGQDGERIQARLRELQETRLASQQAVTPPVQTPTDIAALVTPAPEPFAEADNESTAASNGSPNGLPNGSPNGSPLVDTGPSDEQRQAALVQARREAYRALVADVQRRLNDFGFDAGLPDGVPGRNTRRALSEFHEAVGLPASASITDLTLEDLDDEQRKLARAERLVEDSRRALAQGDRDRALATLEQARQTSALAAIPADLQQAVQAVVISEDSTGDDTPVAIADNDIDDQTASPSATTTIVPAQSATNELSELSELLGQINQLHGRIRRQQADQAQQLRTIREVLPISPDT